MVARETGRRSACFASWLPRQRRPPLDSSHKQHAPLQIQRLSHFGIGLATFTPIGGNIDRYLRPIGFYPLFWRNRNCEIARKRGFLASRLEKNGRTVTMRPTRLAARDWVDWYQSIADTFV